MDNLDDAIRERAYHLWVADGRPEGNADNYWLTAQREILAQAAAVAVDSAVVAAKPEKKAKVARPRKSKRAAA
jgi:hypothetical protein